MCSDLLCFLDLPAADQLCWLEHCQESALQRDSLQTGCGRGSSDQWNLFFSDLLWRSEIGKLGPSDNLTWNMCENPKSICDFSKYCIKQFWSVLDKPGKMTVSTVSMVMLWLTPMSWNGTLLHLISFPSVLCLHFFFCLYDYRGKKLQLKHLDLSWFMLWYCLINS